MKVFRQQRDVRFSPDKSPYKTRTYGIAGRLYVALSATGLYTGTGYYQLRRDQLERYREAVATNGVGPRRRGGGCARHAGLRDRGEALKTAPRGYPRDHPQIALLRRKQLIAGGRAGARRWHHGRARARARARCARGRGADDRVAGRARRAEHAPAGRVQRTRRRTLTSARVAGDRQRADVAAVELAGRRACRAQGGWCRTSRAPSRARCRSPSPAPPCGTTRAAVPCGGLRPVRRRAPRRSACARRRGTSAWCARRRRRPRHRRPARSARARPSGRG